MSHSVFFYFPDYEYARTVLVKMLRKARKWVCILDVPDLACKESAIEQRRKSIGPSYDELYKDLPHLYYPQDWFRQVLAEAGDDVSVTIEPQQVRGYLHSDHRYNVYIQRAGSSRS